MSSKKTVKSSTAIALQLHKSALAVPGTEVESHNPPKLSVSKPELRSSNMILLNWVAVK
jgi:hypothetical protein